MRALYLAPVVRRDPNLGSQQKSLGAFERGDGGEILVARCASVLPIEYLTLIRRQRFNPCWLRLEGRRLGVRFGAQLLVQSISHVSSPSPSHNHVRLLIPCARHFPRNPTASVTRRTKNEAPWGKKAADAAPAAENVRQARSASVVCHHVYVDI